MTASTLLFGATSVLGFNLARLFTQAIMPSRPGIGRKRSGIAVRWRFRMFSFTLRIWVRGRTRSWLSMSRAVISRLSHIPTWQREKKAHCEVAPLSRPLCINTAWPQDDREDHAVLSLSERLKLSYRYYAAAMLTSRPHARPSGAMTVPHHSRLAISLSLVIFVCRFALPPGDCNYDSPAIEHEPVALGELLF